MSKMHRNQRTDNKIMPIERDYKADIIVMREEENGEYRFYLCDRFNDLKGTQEAIENLAERHHAQIAWFPTADPNVATIRKLLKVCGADRCLLQKAVDILNSKGVIENEPNEAD